jgi:cytochrome c-type biogenesis protein CcmF
MLGDLGTATLAVGLACATLTALLWLRVALFAAAIRPARIATAATLLAAVAAGTALETALLRHDFTVRFVAENGGRDVPLYYTVTSLWSALDGSLLLWLMILGGYAVLLARRRYPPRLHAHAMVVVSTVAMFFFAVSYFAANPFRDVRPVPLDGPGPNPLLQQHPAMGVHPPLLYAGYIGLVVPFAFALAAPLAGRDGRAWLGFARSWALVAWAALTAGIGLGAWWSYAVLGWGGYWAWDPVENASLLPWLTATAFLHTALGRAAAGWNTLLASASFVLVLLGTFLTRSGAVTSVHAFTESPLGPMLLGFVLLAVVMSTLLTGWRDPAPVERTPAPLLSRSTALLANGVLLITITAAVLIGTVFPLLAEPLAGTRTTVGPGYYQRTALPLAVVVLLVMGVAPALARRDAAGARRRLRVPGAAALATIAVAGLLSRPGAPALTAFGVAAFVLVGLAGEIAARLPRIRYGGDQTRRSLGLPALLAHAGIALVASGVAGSSAYSHDTEHTVRVGETLRTGDTTVRLVEIRRHRDGRGTAMTARLRPVGAAGTAGDFIPAMRFLAARDTVVTVPDIHSGPLQDTYVTLVAVTPDSGSATVRLAVNPLVGLLWVGGALIASGGLLAAARAAQRRPRDRAASPREPGFLDEVGVAG